MKCKLINNQNISPFDYFLHIECILRFGRYVVATRDIAPGEVIFTEEPLEIGPNHANDVLCCVGCHR